MNPNDRFYPTGRLHSLDVLKGISIFSIVLFHTNRSFSGVFSKLQFVYTWGGYFGNFLFFMLSGFTIFYVYHHKVINNDISLFSFIFRRIQKLYPMYLLSTVVSVIFLIKANGFTALNYKDIFLNLTLTTSGWIEDIYPYNTPCWFLSQLLLLYVIWFIITKYAKEKAAYVYIGFILWGLVLEKYQWHISFSYSHNGEGLTNFFLGCLLCKFIFDLNKSKRYIYETAIIIFAVIFIILAIKFDFREIAGDIKYAFTFLISPALIFAVLDIEFLKRIMECKWIILLFGNISTNIFFWHIPYVSIYFNLFKKIKFCDSLPQYWKYTCYLLSLYIFCFALMKFEQYLKAKQQAKQCLQDKQL